jgi:hypothetical protein
MSMSMERKDFFDELTGIPRINSRKRWPAA